MEIRELSNEQRRQAIDALQVYEAWRTAERDRRRRFTGSMRWVSREGAEYLLRKTGHRETSLGLRSSETELAFSEFSVGRARNRDTLQGLSARLDQMAPVNRALRLGRMPRMAARILRGCAALDILGRQLFVVGTNALFAYEARAGVQVDSGLIATGDIDFLFDARQRLTFAGAEIRKAGFIGLLRKFDQSFSTRQKLDFRAVNRDGYMVDLIRPEGRDVIREASVSGLSLLDEDLQGAPVRGLDWLISAPRFEAVVIADDGYPAPVICIDPRVFGLHKAWLSRLENRDPQKKRRDWSQAVTAIAIAETYLQLSLNADSDLAALPLSLRERGTELRQAAFNDPQAHTTGSHDGLRPGW